MLVTAKPYAYKYLDHSYTVETTLWSMFTNPWHLRFRSARLFDRLFRYGANGAIRNSSARRLSPDIVHLQAVSGPVDRYLVPKLAKRFRTVITVHNVLPHRADDPSYRLADLQRIYMAAHRLIVHSNENKETLVSVYGVPHSKIAVVPLGIDLSSETAPDRTLARTRLGLAERNRFVLFLGTIRKNKGLGTLLKAMASVVRHAPDICLVIAGALPTDTTFAPYEEIIAKNEIQRNVIVRLGFIPQDQLGDYYAAADLVALPYEDFHAQSGVLFDAYKYRRPVVVTDSGGLGGTVREDQTGIVVPPRNAEALAQALVAILSSPERREEIGQRIAVAREKYSWSAVGGATMRLYWELVANPVAE